MKSNCEEYYIGKKIEKRVKKVLTKGKRCDSISKLSARAAEKRVKKVLTKGKRCDSISKLSARAAEKSKNSKKFEEN